MPSTRLLSESVWNLYGLFIFSPLMQNGQVKATKTRFGENFATEAPGRV